MKKKVIKISITNEPEKCSGKSSPKGICDVEHYILSQAGITIRNPFLHLIDWETLKC